MILERASGNPVYQLDLWMAGGDHCRRLLFDAAGDADLILVEGVMGFYDGSPSSADLSALFGIPAVVVISAASIGQTFAAIAHGLTTYRDDITFAGVLANGVASAKHAQMIAAGAADGARLLGSIWRSQTMSLPERHLGLVQPGEVDDLHTRLEAAAGAVAGTDLVDLLPEVEFSEPPAESAPKLLEQLSIAVARDECFSFLYAANLRLLAKMGANLLYFSPLADRTIPPADSLYLPGGYPELYLERLEKNATMKQSITAHFEADKPIYAECGGMLYLLDRLTDREGRSGQMVGLLPGHAVMQNRLAALGYHEAEFSAGTLRGHTFHHSLMQSPLAPAAVSKHLYDGSPGEAVYRLKKLCASYLHLYFPSHPIACTELFLLNS